LYASEQKALENSRTMASFRSILEANMNTSSKRAAGNLPRAVSDLVAEGGNVLASDDAPVSRPVTTYVPARRLHLSKSGRWIERALKS
jgi:hypothetical protein